MYAVGRGDVVTQAFGARFHRKLQVASTELLCFLCWVAVWLLADSLLLTIPAF